MSSCWRSGSTSRTFEPPPPLFRDHALLNDPEVYEQAAADPLGGVGGSLKPSAEACFQKWTRVLTTTYRRSTSGSHRRS